MKAENPGIAFTEINAVISKKWGALTEVRDPRLLACLRARAHLRVLVCGIHCIRASVQHGRGTDGDPKTTRRMRSGPTRSRRASQVRLAAALPSVVLQTSVREREGERLALLHSVGPNGMKLHTPHMSLALQSVAVKYRRIVRGDAIGERHMLDMREELSYMYLFGRYMQLIHGSMSWVCKEFHWNGSPK